MLAIFGSVISVVIAGHPHVVCQLCQQYMYSATLASAPGAQGVGLMREKRVPGIYCMRMRKYTVLFTV